MKEQSKALSGGAAAPAGTASGAAIKAALYARVSTNNQADKALSIPAQLEAMRQHAMQRGWLVAYECVEPGVSGKTANRPALQGLLAKIRSGELAVGVVLVHKIDRFARNVYDHATIKALLQKSGVRLASVVENVDDSVSGQLVENIMASIAEFYSANLSEEVKKGMRQKVMGGGWPHRPPRGYAVVRTPLNPKGSIEVHPKDGPLMRRAFELYAQGGFSMKTLARLLANEGLRASRGQPVSHAHLSRLLSNPFYAGEVTWHGDRHKGAHPPLVSEELFERVQRAMRERRANPGPRGSVIPGFPLRGLAICASCRGRMTCERHGKWSYYRCSRQTFRRELCKGRMCNADRAHAGIERICLQVTISRELAGKIALAAERIIAKRREESGRRAAGREREFARLAARELRLSEAFASGAVPAEAYGREVAKLRRERQEISDVREITPAEAETLAASVARLLSVASSLWELYERLNENGKSALLKTVFKIVILDADGIAGFTLKPPFDAIAARGTEFSVDDLTGSFVAGAEMVLTTEQVRPQAWAESGDGTAGDFGDAKPASSRLVSSPRGAQQNSAAERDAFV